MINETIGYYYGLITAYLLTASIIGSLVYLAIKDDKHAKLISVAVGLTWTPLMYGVFIHLNIILFPVFILLLMLAA